MLKANNVEIIKGEAYFVNANTVRIQSENRTQRYTFKNAILATGSRPVEIPTFKFTNRVLNSTDALNLPELPKKIGCDWWRLHRYGIRERLCKLGC